MFFALVRKELRLLRSSWIVAMAIALLMYGIFWPLTIWALVRDSVQDLRLNSMESLFNVTAMAAVITALLAALFGGVAMPTERRERWADFAAILPVSRARKIAARFAAGASLVTVVWLANALICIVYFAWTRTATWRQQFLQRASSGGGTFDADATLHHNLATIDSGIGTLLFSTAFLSIALFGIAWLFASKTRSPALAAGMSLWIVLFGAFITIQIPAHRHMAEGPYLDVYLRIAALVGVVAMIGGTIQMHRRIEP